MLLIHRDPGVMFDPVFWKHFTDGWMDIGGYSIGGLRCSQTRRDGESQYRDEPERQKYPDGHIITSKDAKPAPQPYQDPCEYPWPPRETGDLGACFDKDYPPRDEGKLPYTFLSPYAMGELEKEIAERNQKRNQK